MAHGYIRLGEVAQALGDYELAQQHYEASRALFEALGTPWGRLSHHFGLLALDRGDVGRARSYLVESLRLQEAKEEREWLSSSLAAFAGLAAAEGQPQRTLRLAGVVDTLQERQGAVLQPTERGRFERRVAGARQALSLADANAAWEAGRAMTPDQAVAYALGEESPPGTLPV
jgi:non-specific serine/threonine protein kinase